MNCNSPSVMAAWNKDDMTMKIQVLFSENDGVLTPGNDDYFEMVIKTTDDAWNDLQGMAKAFQCSSPQRIRLSNGRLLDVLLWVPLMHKLMRFVEVTDLGLTLEADE